ncbi:hypothetical protein CRG98_038690 [Punica granatum]|uniref:Retrotransposon gag domain-containing protein n=1 Tax=Punica granatum TaxID=22663 RepID=A0A2I0IA94_PUNGR|nr:hypothetical protein CRG98_038690 [Punica granatum]
MTHAPPPPTPAGAPPAHSGAIPPLIPMLEAQAPSTSIDSAARIIALEGEITTLKGTVNEMVADMVELMALLRAPNRTSSNSTPPPGYGPTVDPNPWVPSTHAPKGIEAPAMHAPVDHPANVLPPPVILSAGHSSSTVGPNYACIAADVHTSSSSYPRRSSADGAALDWYMSLKAADIPTWANLSSKFIDQYRYCAETPPTLLELSTMEMTEGQGFEAYAVKWRARAAKHVLGFENSSAGAASPTPQDQHGGAIQPWQCKQFTPLLAALSHRYRQLLAGNKIRPIAPNPDFDPTIQDQSRRCEYHQGALGHTTDNCWKLRERIQQMIDDKQVTLNAVRPPNV